MKLSITELKRAREGMTKGEFHIEEDRNGQCNIHSTEDPWWIAILPTQCVVSIETKQRINAEAITATLNAADTLIEIAEAGAQLQHEGWDFRSPTMDRLLAGLRKVRP